MYFIILLFTVKTYVLLQLWQYAYLKKLYCLVSVHIVQQFKAKTNLKNYKIVFKVKTISVVNFLYSQ